MFFPITQRIICGLTGRQVNADCLGLDCSGQTVTRREAQTETFIQLLDVQWELMPLAPELEAIDGAQKLYEWFGHWPSFHDAEVVSLHLNRVGPSSLVIHTWEMTDQVDAHNYFILTKHVVVEFILIDVSELELGGFSSQNVLSGLDIEKLDEGLPSEDPCRGI